MNINLPSSYIHKISEIKAENLSLKNVFSKIRCNPVNKMEAIKDVPLIARGYFSFEIDVNGLREKIESGAVNSLQFDKNENALCMTIDQIFEIGMVKSLNKIFFRSEITKYSILHVKPISSELISRFSPLFNRFITATLNDRNDSLYYSYSLDSNDKFPEYLENEVRSFELDDHDLRITFECFNILAPVIKYNMKNEALPYVAAALLWGRMNMMGKQNFN